MKGNRKPFTWIALFRDGRSIEQAKSDSDSAAFRALVDYLYGTPGDPKRHYLLWFTISDGESKFVVSFDRDGDAYINTPDGNLVMTEFKIRSAELLYRMEKDRENSGRIFYVGFGGEDTRGVIDGKVIRISEDGSYVLTSVSLEEYAIIKT